MTTPEAAPSPERARGLDATTKIVLFSLSLAGLAALLALVAVRGHNSVVGSAPVAWPLLAVGFALADLFAVHVELRDNAHSFTMNELPLMVGLFLCSPGQMIFARVAAMLVALVVVRRQRPLKTLFNLALGTLETVSMVTVFLIAVKPLGNASGALVWGGAIAAAVIVNLINSAAIAVVIRLSGAPHEPGSAARMALFGALTAVGMASLGIACVIVIENDPIAVALIAAVAGVIYVAYRGYATEAQRYGNLEKLYELTRKLACSPSLEDSMRFTLQEACELVRAEESELTLLENGENSTSMVRVRLTKERELQMISEVHAADSVHATAMQTQGAVVISRTTNDPTERRYLAANRLLDIVVVPVFQSGAVVGTLAAHNRLGDVSTFDDEDAKVFATLAHHVGTALENARLIERLRTEVAQKEYQALHDTLTGLGNRDLFTARAEAALRESHAGGWQVAVMLMDLNRFKDVNDTLGHHHGDLLLQQVAERVTHAMSPTATIARLGGDEFAMLLPQIRSTAEAEHAAIAVQTALQHPFVVGRVQLAVNAAIGISVAPAHGTDVSTLLQHADIAMYNAKDNRDAGVEIYDAENNRHSTRRLTLAAELQAAITERELEVYYQPKADLSTGRIVGVEALARWQHPQHGPIPPDEFVELAESTGLMRQMTTLVLELALDQIREWGAVGLVLPVSVNLSARSLLDVDLAEQLEAMCRAHSVDPRHLILEITETQMMADPQRTISLLERIAELGIEVSIDDFGTGYSSLAYLQRLPVHEIKVDKSFVLAMTADDTNTKIVRSIIDLGHNLQLRVVAEGVEDRYTWDTLEALGCDIAQGYYLSRPLPAHQLTPGSASSGSSPTSITRRRAGFGVFDTAFRGLVSGGSGRDWRTQIRGTTSPCTTA